MKLLSWWMWLAWNWMCRKAGFFRSRKGSVCKQFVGTSTVLFQNTPIYIFLLCCICIGVCCYCSDSEAVITFPQWAVFFLHITAFYPAERSHQVLPSGITAAGKGSCTVHYAWSWRAGFALYHAAKPRKWNHLVAKAARRILAHSLVQAHQSQSKASPLFLWICAQGCCFRSCWGFRPATGKMTWSLACFLILAFRLQLCDGWNEDPTNARGNEQIPLFTWWLGTCVIRSGSACQ